MQLSQNDRLIIFEFMRLFCRLEMALKSDRGNLNIPKNRRYEPNIDWGVVREKFKSIDYEEVQDSVDRLLAKPPRKWGYLREKKKYDFRDYMIYNDESPEDDILDIVKTIRNNLFHGGKFHQLPEGSERDVALIQDAIAVIKFWVKDRDFLEYYFADFSIEGEAS